MTLFIVYKKHIFITFNYHQQTTLEIMKINEAHQVI